MTLVQVRRCDDLGCGATISESSTTRISITGSFTIFSARNQKSQKFTQLDFCEDTCFKNFVDDFDPEV